MSGKPLRRLKPGCADAAIPQAVPVIRPWPADDETRIVHFAEGDAGLDRPLADLAIPQARSIRSSLGVYIDGAHAMAQMQPGQDVYGFSSAQAQGTAKLPQGRIEIAQRLCQKVELTAGDIRSGQAFRLEYIKWQYGTCGCACRGQRSMVMDAQIAPEPEDRQIGHGTNIEQNSDESICSRD